MIKRNKKAAPKAVDHDHDHDHELDLGRREAGKPRGQGLFISPLSNGALRAALAFGSTRFGPSQMHIIGQASHLALSNQKRQLP